MSRDVNIGYWFSEEIHPEYPMPMADTAKPDQAQVIAALKRAWETGYVTSYRGSSTCRLCKKQNGFRELEIIRGDTKYRIPEGYLHYLEEHQVGYTDELKEALE